MDEKPFLRNNTNVTPLVQFEACGIAVARLLEEGITPKTPKDSQWIEDRILVEASTGASNTRKKLEARIVRAKEIFSGKFESEVQN